MKKKVKFLRPRMRACDICGKMLWSKKSRRLGIGPECAKKVNPYERLERQGQMRLL